MKHSIQTIKQFVELRADGRSLGHISETLDIPYSTLGDWNIRYRPQIDLRRAIHWERCEANSQLAPDKDLARLTQLIHRCQAELDQRPIEDFTNSELLRLLSSARRDYFKRRDLILAPLEPRPSVAQPKETSTSLGLPFSPELRQKVDAIGRRLEEQEAREAALADGISTEPINTPLEQSETDPSPEPDKTGQKPDALPNHHNGNHLQEPILPSARPDLLQTLKRRLQAAADRIPSPGPSETPPSADPAPINIPIHGCNCDPSDNPNCFKSLPASHETGETSAESLNSMTPMPPTPAHPVSDPFNNLTKGCS